MEADASWTPVAFLEGVRVVTSRQPTVEKSGERCASHGAICAHVKSNAVISPLTPRARSQLARVR